MIVRKIVLAASVIALTSTTAWAMPGTPHHAGKGPPSSTPVGPPATTPNNGDNPGAANRSHGDHGNSGTSGGSDSGSNGGANNPSHPSHPSHPGKSHKCMAHTVAYVATGTLVSQTLSANADGSYSGELSVTVTHTNHHAAPDKGTTKSYTLTNARVRLHLADINADGTVGLDDLQAGDQVKLIGRITTLAKKCDQSGFTAQTTIGKVKVRGPAK